MPGTVTVDPADLERLVRLAHQINRDTVVMFHGTAPPWECICGHLLALEHDDPASADAESFARADHGTHVAYHVRQALAGRIEL